MELRQLNTFIQVARFKSFSRAAESLGYSQSAVTVQIRQLEEELDARLFDRIGKHISLTAQGEQFLAHAYDVLNQVNKARLSVSETGALHGRLHLGTIESLCFAKLPAVLRRYWEKHPQVVVHVTTGEPEALIRRMEQGELDLIYILDEPRYNNNWHKLMERREEVVFVASPSLGAELRERPVLTVEGLLDKPFYLTERDANYRRLLDRRLAELGGEQAALERVRQVCGALRAEGVSFSALDAGRYLQDLDAPALPAGSGGEWWMRTTLPPLPATDTLPTVHSAFKRFFARGLDTILLFAAMLVTQCVVGKNPARFDRVDTVFLYAGSVALMAVLEPLSLRLFGTTPGKALMGLRLTGADGKKLRWADGFFRYVWMLWSACGFYIPILSIIQLYRSFERCRREETQPWDRETIYTETTFRFRNVAAIALLLALLAGGVNAANAAAQLPPNRGDLTVAEFAENFNYQAEYLGIDLGGELDSDGVWQEAPGAENITSLVLGEEIPTPSSSSTPWKMENSPPWRCPGRWRISTGGTDCPGSG